MRFNFTVQSDVAEIFDRQYKRTATAVTSAMAEVGEKAKQLGRANIGSAGFSTRWQNALRLETYPKTGASISPAALIFHKIPYSGVFERPTQIQGKSLLWLPLPEAEKLVVGRAATPARLEAQGRKLHYVARSGKPPLLVGEVASIQATSKLGGRTLSRRMVPLFVGLTSVQLRTHFDVAGAVREAARGLPAAITKYLKKEFPDG